MQVLKFGAMLLSGGAIVYSFWLSLATLVFWFVKITNILVIFESTYEAGRWPLVIYPGWLRASLTFIRAGRGRRDDSRRSAGGPFKRQLHDWRDDLRRNRRADSLALVLDLRDPALFRRVGVKPRGDEKADAGDRQRA